MYKNTVKRKVNKVALIKKSLKKFKPCFDIDTELSLKQFLDSLTGEDIAWGLINNPKLSSYLSSKDFRKLDGDDWSGLLSCKPQLADKCDFDLLDGYDWSWLLKFQPQFSDKCDFDLLDGEDWRRLLINQPQFADKCDFDKLDGYNWRRLLSYQPQLAKHRT